MEMWRNGRRGAKKPRLQVRTLPSPPRPITLPHCEGWNTHDGMGIAKRLASDGRFASSRWRKYAADALGVEFPAEAMEDNS